MPTAANIYRVINNTIKTPFLCFFVLLVTGCGISEKKNADTVFTNKDSLTSIRDLGRHLFYDNNLSFNQTKSCGSCHHPSLAFTDGYRKSSTASGDNVLRNAPSLINVVYQKRLDWANPFITDSYQQNERPLFNEHPIELGAKNNEEKILSGFKTDSLYRSLFEAAYPNDAGITFIHIRKALSAFVNSLVSFQSPYDKYAAGDTMQLPAAAKNGLRLFFSPQLNCASCHTPPLFSVNDIRNNLPADSIYFNIGLYNYTYISKDSGLFLFTKKINDLGKFKVPSLRNTAITAPYMHDGSIYSLDKVIDIHSRGGQIIDMGEEKGDGRFSPNKDRRIKGFSITAKEKTDLIEFLYSLTDSTVLSNPAFANPHKY